jgi:hypothetical protein
MKLEREKNMLVETAGRKKAKKQIDSRDRFRKLCSPIRPQA